MVTYSCELCGFSSIYSTRYRDHCMTRKHLRNLEQMEKDTNTTTNLPKDRLKLEEFNFTDHKEWLFPFLEKFKTQQDIPEIDTFAINNLEKIFILNRMIFSTSISDTSFDKENWKRCAKLNVFESMFEGCRKSSGFNDNSVPSDVKYNVNHLPTDNELLEQSYIYLIYCDDIYTVIDTGLSDYTRRNDDVLNKYRLIEYLQKKSVKTYKSYSWIDILISAYKKDIITIINTFSQLSDSDIDYDFLKQYTGDFIKDDKIHSNLKFGVESVIDYSPSNPVRIKNNVDSFFSNNKKRRFRKSKKFNKLFQKKKTITRKNK